MKNAKHRLIALGVVLSLLSLGILLERLWTDDGVPPPDEGARGSGRSLPIPTSSGASGPATAPSATEGGSFVSEAFSLDDPAWSWSRVDLESLQEELPENRFWTLAAPTDHPQVLAEREETRARWRKELGRIMANTATEEEVRAFYGERQQVSSDYVELTSVLLNRYADVLPERDLGLIRLARELHRARLEEIPRRLTEAIQRSHEHAAVREAWLADEAEFNLDPAEKPNSAHTE